MSSETFVGRDLPKVDARQLTSRAFTSLELLVVLAVLILMGAVFFPAMAGSKEKEVRIQCMNNEKQLFTSFQIYCNDNGDKLPLITSGNWPWDAPTAMTTPMTNSGCTKKTFYCPSTAPRFTDQINWAAANSLWNYGGPSYSITGYAYALAGAGSKIDPQFQNQTLLTEVHPNGPLLLRDIPATREVLADVMISTGSALPASGADNFSSIPGGFALNGILYPHLSAHLGKGQVPAGGNIAFKDGHVQWRKFDASNPSALSNPTKVRTAGGTSPYFWW